MPHRKAKTGDVIYVTGTRYQPYSKKPIDLEMDRRRAIFEAIKQLGEVVYAIRCKDGAIKIGWTRNLNNRRHAFTSNLQAILAVVPGTYDDEQALHRQFRPHLARGAEYYHATPEILAWVNEVRQRCGIETIAA